MKVKEVRYVHYESVHNFCAAEEIVPFVIDLLKPKSVVDVGCGLATWLKVFEEYGVEDILGIDGSYVDKSLIKIDLKNFAEFDLEQLFVSEKKYDLAISLEVAEHLSYECANVFIKTLTDLSDTIIFSAAIPNQGGQNHINEQEPKYWIQKFEDQGYKLFDVLRPVFWENDKVESWYKQNILLFTKRSDLQETLISLVSLKGIHLVHPEIFNINIYRNGHYKNQYYRIASGKKDIRFYIKLLMGALESKLRRKWRQ